MTLYQNIPEVRKKGGRCDESAICIMSRMYRIHIGLILWHGHIWTTHQTDDVSQVRLYVTFSNGWQYNLCESRPPPVISTRETKAVEMLDLLPVPISKKKGNLVVFILGHHKLCCHQLCHHPVKMCLFCRCIDYTQ